MDLRGIRFLSVCVPLSRYVSHLSGLSTRLIPSPAAQVASQGGTQEDVRVPVRVYQLAAPLAGATHVAPIVHFGGSLLAFSVTLS